MVRENKRTLRADETSSNPIISTIEYGRGGWFYNFHVCTSEIRYCIGKGCIQLQY